MCYSVMNKDERNGCVLTQRKVLRSLEAFLFTYMYSICLALMVLEQGGAISDVITITGIFSVLGNCNLKSHSYSLV